MSEKPSIENSGQINGRGTDLPVTSHWRKLSRNVPLRFIQTVQTLANARAVAENGPAQDGGRARHDHPPDVSHSVPHRRGSDPRPSFPGPSYTSVDPFKVSVAQSVKTMISGRLEGPSSSLESVVVHSGQRPHRQSALAHKSHSPSSTSKHILPSQPIKATQVTAQGRPHSPPSVGQPNNQDDRSRRRRRLSTSPVLVELPIPSSEVPATITAQKVSRSPSPVVDRPNSPSRPRVSTEPADSPARSDSHSSPARRSPVIIYELNSSLEPIRSPAEIPLPPSSQSTSSSSPRPLVLALSHSGFRSPSPSRRKAYRRHRASISPSSSRSSSSTRGSPPRIRSPPRSHRRSRRRSARSHSPDVVIIRPTPRTAVFRSPSRSPRRHPREGRRRHAASKSPYRSRSSRRRRTSSLSPLRNSRSPSPYTRRHSYRERHRRTSRSRSYSPRSHSPDFVVIEPPPRPLHSPSPPQHRRRRRRRSTSASYAPYIRAEPITISPYPSSYPAYSYPHSTIYPPSNYDPWSPVSNPTPWSIRPISPPIPPIPVSYPSVRFHDSIPQSPPQSINERHHSSRSPSPTTPPITPPRIPSRPASVASVIPEPADRIDPRSASFGVNILNIKLGSTETMTAKKISRHKYLIFIIMDLIPRQMYLNFLLRLPYLYFSRVSRIFEDAELTVKEIKDMALDDCTAVQTGYAVPAPLYYPSPVSYGDDSDWQGLPPLPSQSFTNLKSSWETFVDSLIKEWKTFNIVSVLLLSAILTILQIQSAENDPVTRYSALLSLICALMSLLYGGIYIIRFGAMRKTHKAAEWADEAQKTGTAIWWNVWVMLAMPATWLAWSMILYIVCIMAFVWQGPADFNTPGPDVLWPRILISVVLGLGVIYFVLIVSTFRQYGEAMDRDWGERARMRRWAIEMEKRKKKEKRERKQKQQQDKDKDKDKDKGEGMQKWRASLVSLVSAGTFRSWRR